VVVVKTRKCTHEVKVLCAEDPDVKGICPKKCPLILPACEHPCTKSCMEDCLPCTVEIKAIHPQCEHLVSKRCGDDFSNVVCTSKCLKELRCGHACQDLCGFDCSKSKCRHPVAKVRSDCGHDVELYCWEYRAG